MLSNLLIAHVSDQGEYLKKKEEKKQQLHNNFFILLSGSNLEYTP